MKITDRSLSSKRIKTNEFITNTKIQKPKTPKKPKEEKSKILIIISLSFIFSVLCLFFFIYIYQFKKDYPKNSLKPSKLIQISKIQEETQSQTQKKNKTIENKNNTLTKNITIHKPVNNKKNLGLTIEKIKKFIGNYDVNKISIILYCIFFDKEEGFYIDVGANDPNKDSVTKIFYINGWNGINIEPVPELYKKYFKYRPNDINLGKAISDKEGDIILYISPNNSTIIPENKYDYVDNPKEIVVNMTTLGKICNEYIKDEKIDFLKIDVEGAEKLVLLGYNFKKYRPKVIVIQSIRWIKGKKVPDYENWENILFNNYYSFVYENDLHRYYVDNKVMGLKERFTKVDYFLEELSMK